jgi:hypothetical protein
MFLVPAGLAMCHVKLFECMGYLGAICTFGFLTAYILISIAAPLYLHKIGKLEIWHLVCSALAIGFMTIPVLGSVGVPGSRLFPPPEAPYNLFPYLFLAYLLITCSFFMVQRRRSPQVVCRMQRDSNDSHANLRFRT